MLSWLADDRNPQLEIVSNFKITDKRIFSVAGQMLKTDNSRCRLPDERFETLMFIDSNKDFKH